MTTAVLHFVPIALLAIASFITFRARDGHTARALGVGGAALSLALSVVASVSAAGEAADGAREVDGISTAFVLFTGVLALTTLLGAPTGAGIRSRATRVLLTTASLEAMFVVRAPILVFVLFTASAIPTYVAIRGNRGPTLTARGFATHQVISALFVGMGLFFRGRTDLSALLLCIGIFARQGVFPLHSWAPPVFQEAPLGSAAIFLHSQAGAYLLARLLLSTPDAVPTLFLDGAGVATALYGAMLACAQPNAKRSLGYLALSQSALVLTGLASGGVTGAAGGILLVIGVGLAQAGAAVTLECVKARRGALAMGSKGYVEIDHGLLATFLFLGLACVGLPATIGFAAEDLVFHSALAHRPFVGVGMVVATALAGLAVLRIYFGLTGGERRGASPGLLLRERVALVGLSALLLGLGLAPRPAIATIASAVVSHR